LGQIALIALNILALCLYFSRRKPFQRTYITYLLATLVVVVVDGSACSIIPYLAEDSHGAHSRDIFRAFFQAVIWCSYMLKSQRVKATFVR